jgi:hypothetical protein
LNTIGEIEGIYIQKLANQLPDMKKFLEKRRKNIPSLRERGSAIHLTCPTIAIIGSICIGGALQIFFLIVKLPMPFSASVTFLGDNLKIIQAIIIFGFPIISLFAYRNIYHKNIR